jgi:hypothetical protein
MLGGRDAFWAAALAACAAAFAFLAAFWATFAAWVAFVAATWAEFTAVTVFTTGAPTPIAAVTGCATAFLEFVDLTVEEAAPIYTWRLFFLVFLLFVFRLVLREPPERNVSASICKASAPKILFSSM